MPLHSHDFFDLVPSIECTIPYPHRTTLQPCRRRSWKLVRPSLLLLPFSELAQVVSFQLPSFSLEVSLILCAAASSTEASFLFPRWELRTIVDDADLLFCLLPCLWAAQTTNLWWFSLKQSGQGLVFVGRRRQHCDVAMVIDKVYRTD